MDPLDRLVAVHRHHLSIPLFCRSSTDQLCTLTGAHMSHIAFGRAYVQLIPTRNDFHWNSSFCGQSSLAQLPGNELCTALDISPSSQCRDRWEGETTHVVICGVYVGGCLTSVCQCRIWISDTAHQLASLDQASFVFLLSFRRITSDAHDLPQLGVVP